MDAATILYYRALPDIEPVQVSVRMFGTRAHNQEEGKRHFRSVLFASQPYELQNTLQPLNYVLLLLAQPEPLKPNSLIFAETSTVVEHALIDYNLTT